MTLNNDEVAAYYAARASEYDRSAGYEDAVAEGMRVAAKKRYQQLVAGRCVLEVACGTGYWTRVIAETAQSVLATDANQSMLDIARHRLSGVDNVRLQLADAYSLDGVPEGFTGAFAHWWWSHIPKKRIGQFLSALHRRLAAGAVVVFVDHLSTYRPSKQRTDQEGDVVEERVLAEGRKFEVVKNFPTEDELREVLRDVGEEIVYQQYPQEHTWVVSYRARG